jgi:hypothetical protein
MIWKSRRKDGKKDMKLFEHENVCELKILKDKEESYTETMNRRFKGKWIRESLNTLTDSEKCESYQTIKIRIRKKNIKKIRI